MPLKPDSALRKDRTMPSGRAVFQHRHYAVIADIIRKLELPGDHHETVLRHFALHLRETNPNFNRDRFVAAARKEINE